MAKKSRKQRKKENKKRKVLGQREVRPSSPPSVFLDRETGKRTSSVPPPPPESGVQRICEDDWEDEEREPPTVDEIVLRYIYKSIAFQSLMTYMSLADVPKWARGMRSALECELGNRTAAQEAWNDFRFRVRRGKSELVNGRFYRSSRALRCAS